MIKLAPLITIALVILGISLSLTFSVMSVQVYGQNPPGLPVIFSGNVMLNGVPAADGLNVTALDNGQVVGSALTSGGAYSLTACGEEGQTCNDGDVISFLLNGQLTAGQTVTFDSSKRGFPFAQDLTFTGTIGAGQTAATTMATLAEITQSTQSQTVVTVVSTLSTPEYQNFTIIALAALLIVLGVITATRRRTA